MSDTSSRKFVPLFDKLNHRQGHFQVDEEDSPKLEGRHWILHSEGYVVSGSVWKGDYVYLHRYLMGDCGMVDHINGDRLDNRRCNLRKCTHQQNMQNHPDPFGSNPHVGVSRRGTKWRSYITINNKQKSLGVFRDLADAIGARRRGEKEYFGDFAPNRIDLCTS